MTKGHTITIEPEARHVRVSVKGVVLAESDNAKALHETGLPTRWYIPKADVRMDALEPTNFSSQCPFKGQAEYWSAEIGGEKEHNIAWSYPTPIPGAEEIGGLIAFYNDRVDLHVEEPS
jgi:uncharacterized protein (DUF427 family)